MQLETNKRERFSELALQVKGLVLFCWLTCVAVVLYVVAVLIPDPWWRALVMWLAHR